MTGKFSSYTAKSPVVGTDQILITDNDSTAVSKSVVLSAIKTYTSLSPTLVTPALGTPSSGVLTSCTGLPLGGLVATTVSRALVSNASGVIVPATTTDTEIGYVNGVTSAIQTQMDLKAPLTSPTLVTPALGTPSSGTLTNCTIPFEGVTYAINAQTGTTYTFVLADAGKIVTSSNAATVAMTIPPNSSVAFPIGSSLTVISIGAGLTNFAQGAGVTITSTGATAAAPVLRIQHSSATAIKTATDTWRVVGDIA
jgi:hypothetical protein